MKEISLKYRGLKVKHLRLLAKISENMPLKDKIEVVSGILEIDKGTLYRIDYEALSMLFEVIVKDLEKCTKSNLVKSFSLDGQTYKFVEESKQPVGWHIDVSNIELTPENIMALYYLESECTNYSEVNDDGTQKFNTYQRAEKMKEVDLSIYTGLCEYLKKKMNLWTLIMNKLIMLQM